MIIDILEKDFSRVLAHLILSSNSILSAVEHIRSLAPNTASS